MARPRLPSGPIYMLEDSDETMRAPKWPCYLSIAEGALHLVPLCHQDQPMLKEVMAENCGLVSYIPNRCIFCQKSAHQMPGLYIIVRV